MPTFKLNNALNGIEIYFDSKPDEEVLQELRENGWRWHQGKKCWYARQNAESKALAERLCEPSVPQRNRRRFNIDELYDSLCNDSLRSAPVTVKFDIVSGNLLLSHVQITKTGEQYSIQSTNNQIVCSDCKRLFSIHAFTCPFCGCPLSYVVEATYNERLRFHQQEETRARETQRKKEEFLRQEAERARRAIEEEKLLERRRAQEERERQEAEKRRQIEEKALKRYNDIKELCKEHSVPAETIKKLDASGISLQDLDKRIKRIVAYQDAYPSLNIKVSTFIMGDKIGEFVSSFGGPQGETRAQCTGDCATCTRSECVEERMKKRFYW